MRRLLIELDRNQSVCTVRSPDCKLDPSVLGPFNGYSVIGKRAAAPVTTRADTRVGNAVLA